MRLAFTQTNSSSLRVGANGYWHIFITNTTRVVTKFSIGKSSTLSNSNRGKVTLVGTIPNCKNIRLCSSAILIHHNCTLTHLNTSLLQNQASYIRDTACSIEDGIHAQGIVAFS